MDIIHSSPNSGFLVDLSIEQLNKLRQVCQKVHKDNMFRSDKPYHPMSLKEVDKWIESMGEKVRQKRIKIAVDNKVV
tara:strand:+ start:2674 stop:2904 length:231 start_codon:yes stop_codon:yes gene_type:complete